MYFNPSLEIYTHVMDGHGSVLYTMQIDVENPCVVMSQDKSREFLHSGNDKDKFKVLFCVSYSLSTVFNRCAILTLDYSVLFQGHTSAASGRSFTTH